jgi:hypothetical protein
MKISIICMIISNFIIEIVFGHNCAAELLISFKLRLPVMDVASEQC